MLGKASDIETKKIFIMAMIKDGGYEKIIVPVEWIGKLAESIKNKGNETLTMASGKTLDVVGFIVTGKMTGERIIVSGSEAPHE